MPLVQSSAVVFVAPGWLDELTLRSEPPWLSMGTRALREGPFTTSGPDREVWRGRKVELLRAVHDEVSVSLTGAATVTVTDEAAQLVSQVTGSQLDPAWPPLEAAALLVPDDLVVLLRLDGGWRMAAGVVCFPSHWAPAEKLGLPVAAIHGPVPHYADELGQRVDRFLDQLHPGRAVWRRNWTIHASPELYAPRPVTTRAPVAPEDHWLRSERQVLTAQPGRTGILFTIGTDQVPIAVMRDRPELATRMAGALRSMPGELATYRFGALDVDVLADWLVTPKPR
jgi:dimethylamine monooxygenase subunit A